jgi:GAF domain-containing protein
LHQVTARIHETENLDQIMLEASQDICKLLNADRLTLYAVNEDQTAIISKVKTGLNSSRDLKLPISPQSIAGYVAFSRKQLNLADVYDDEALKQIHPSLTFLKEVDKRSGYRTRRCWWPPFWKATCAAWRAAGHQQQERPAFGDLEVEGVTNSCAKRWPLPFASASKGRRKRPRTRPTKYDGLVC